MFDDLTFLSLPDIADNSGPLDVKDLLLDPVGDISDVTQEVITSSESRLAADLIKIGEATTIHGDLSYGEFDWDGLIGRFHDDIAAFLVGMLETEEIPVGQEQTITHIPGDEDTNESVVFDTNISLTSSAVLPAWDVPETGNGLFEYTVTGDNTGIYSDFTITDLVFDNFGTYPENFDLRFPAGHLTAYPADTPSLLVDIVFTPDESIPEQSNPFGFVGTGSLQFQPADVVDDNGEALRRCLSGDPEGVNGGGPLCGARFEDIELSLAFQKPIFNQKTQQFRASRFGWELRNVNDNPIATYPDGSNIPDAVFPVPANSLFAGGTQFPWLPIFFNLQEFLAFGATEAEVFKIIPPNVAKPRSTNPLFSLQEMTALEVQPILSASDVKKEALYDELMQFGNMISASTSEELFDVIVNGELLPFAGEIFDNDAVQENLGSFVAAVSTALSTPQDFNLPPVELNDVVSGISADREIQDMASPITLDVSSSDLPKTTVQTIREQRFTSFSSIMHNLKDPQIEGDLLQL